MENITQVFGLPCVVAINRFVNDTDAELALIRDKCRALGVNVALSEVWAKGGAGARTWPGGAAAGGAAQALPVQL